MLLVLFRPEVMVKEKVQQLSAVKCKFSSSSHLSSNGTKAIKPLITFERENTVCMSGFIKRPLILVLDGLSKAL